MRIAYAYASHHRNYAAGGTIHIKQFIANAIALGHEIWTWPGDEHPGTYRLPEGRLNRIKALRQIDAICYRIDFYPPVSKHWMMPPYRQLINAPLMVWEFNGVPEFARVIGQSEADVQRIIKELRYYGHQCDLAICVSDLMADYVQDILGIKRVLTVPNGSDPNLFHPNVPPISRIQPSPDRLNVVWIGSGELSWNNFDLLRQTAQLLWQRNKNFQIAFHIIGPLSKGLMRDMPPTVHYHGLENYEMLPAWLAAMDVGLCLYSPGIADYNSPLKLFDYMASGLMVISTPQPQIEQVFAQLEQTDLIVPPDQPAVLADILLSLASDRERVRCQGKKGRRLVLDFYNWRRSVQDTIQEIERILEEH